jgi:hypothetical protein
LLKQTTNKILDRKIEETAAGLRPSYAKVLRIIPEENATIIAVTYLPTIGGILILTLSLVYPNAFGILPEDQKVLNIYTIAPRYGAISTVSIFLSS